MSIAAESVRSERLDKVGYSFKSAMAAVRRLRGRETHRPGQLSYAQYSLLFGLASAAELSTSELGRGADLAPGTVTQMLDGLEAAGLVARTRSEHDKRVVMTALTEHGRRVVDERRAQMEPRWRAALEDFSDAELLAAAAVLERLAEFFDAMSDNPEEAT